MLEAIKGFLVVAFGPDPAEITDLCRALDRLALSVHDTPEGEPTDDDRAPPRNDYVAVRERIAPRFPGLGHYALAWPLDTDGQALTGDAIDDLADIALDLSEVVWRVEHFGMDDAAWHFRFLYVVHWGRHLHHLRVYLHALQPDG